MEKMKHMDGYAPSAEDTKKLNEIVTWLVDNGYNGIMLVHKGDIGVSWVSEPDADSVRHTLINSIGHILDESTEAAANLIGGMSMVVDQITSDLRKVTSRR